MTSVKYIVILPLMLCSCVYNMAINPKAKPGRIEHHTAHHFFYGATEAEIESKCKNGVYRIDENRLFIKHLLVAFVTIGFYIPTDIEITCIREEE